MLYSLNGAAAAFIYCILSIRTEYSLDVPIKDEDSGPDAS